MARIIVSYRRSDTAAITGRIFDRLTGHYGEQSVFMDVDNIPFGTDFRQHISNVLRGGDILLAVVGKNWLGARAGTTSRLMEAADPVRVEVETAMRQGVTIIPVLVDDASMPDATELPESLQEFAYINAAPVDIGRDFRAHMDRLIRSIDGILAAAKPETAPAAVAAVPVASTTGRTRSRIVGISLALVAVLVLAALASMFGDHLFRGKAPEQSTADGNAISYPAFAGRVFDESGHLALETRAALTKRLDELENRVKVNVVVALLRGLPPTANLLSYGEELARRWKLIDGDQILFIVHPKREATLHIAEGASSRLDRNASDYIVTDASARVRSGDTPGSFMVGVNNLVEALTDLQAWRAKETYRVLPKVSDNVQNLREGPATTYPIVHPIPAASTGIAIKGCRKSEDGTKPWCAATWKGMSGWISSCCIVGERTGHPPRME